MEQKEQKTVIGLYEAPSMEVLAVGVEKGFSVTANVSDWGDGGSLGDVETE